MKRKDFSRVECSIARAVDEVAEPWTLLVLRHAFLGATQFAEFETALGIPTNTLTRRLEDLVIKGLLDRRPRSEHPLRFDYTLTQKALELVPVFISLATWGSRWKSPGGPPFNLVHPDTGEALEPILVDRKTGHPLTSGQIALAPGRGASAELKRRFRRIGKERLVFGPRAGEPKGAPRSPS
jgi:DNA-binding HxlR family transcriptional regulator